MQVPALAVPVPRPVTNRLLAYLPSSIPGHPWSYIAVDFIMGLNGSIKKNIILTVDDHFSKASWLVAMSKLP